MKFLSGRHLHRWWIPLATGAIFFFIIACAIPYASSLYDVNKSLVGLVLALCSFGNSAQKGTTSYDYSYCAFVPFIFAYLVYLRKEELDRAVIKQSNFGLGLMALGVFIYWFGIRANNQYFGYASIQMLLAGVILWLWGWGVFRILLFPWAFFAFAWPLPFLEPIIAFPLRMNMSTMAAHLLPMLGIPCVQDGTALLSAPDPLHNLPLGARYQIDIADPCSGIRSLFALLMFSALFGYLFLPRLWQQWFIFLSAFPLSILGNLARVIMLVLGCLWFGSSFALGTVDEPSTFHEGCGFLVYGVAMGMEFFIASLLTREWKFGSDSDDDDELE